jgi:hypothetical protein
MRISFCNHLRDNNNVEMREIEHMKDFLKSKCFFVEISQQVWSIFKSKCCNNNNQINKYVNFRMIRHQHMSII